MKKIVAIAGLALLGHPCSAQDYEAGEKLFKMNCASCHKMDAKLIGPPLQNVVKEQGADWTKRWILNNEELRKSGDAHANAIYADYNNMVMPNYSYLSDEEISGVVNYLENWGTKQAESKAPTTVQATATTSGEIVVEQKELSFASRIVLFTVVAAVLLMLITMYTLLKAFKAIIAFRTKES